MTAGFTRYQLRARAKDLGIAVRYGQFATYIAKGLLPDPEAEAWVEEEIVPRFLRIHALEATVRSLDRRVVVLALERYPVPAAKLRDAMVGMLPTIKAPARKMARIEAASQWFSGRFRDTSALGARAVLPAAWRPPPPAAWGTVLREADPDVFAHRLGLEQYHAALLATFGKGTPHALTDLPPEEKLVLLMVRYLAEWCWFQDRARERMAEAEVARQTARGEAWWSTDDGQR